MTAPRRFHGTQSALDLAPAAIAPTASTAKPPDKFTYALPAFTMQRRKTGWWISPTWSAGEKPQWTGPFATIEAACLSIARKLAIEIAAPHAVDRATRVDARPSALRLKPTTRLDAP
jgi:hypothetical protein